MIEETAGRMTSLATEAFSVLIIKPVRIAHGALGDRIWNPLERLAGLLGSMAGIAARPFLVRNQSAQHPMQPLVHFATIVESSLGIQGTNELIDEKSARRLVHHCPFSADLQDITPFCTRLGYIAGRAACEKLVAGSDFRIVSTLSQGDPHCEYIFSNPGNRYVQPGRPR